MTYASIAEIQKLDELIRATNREDWAGAAKIALQASLEATTPEAQQHFREIAQVNSSLAQYEESKRSNAMMLEFMQRFSNLLHMQSETTEAVQQIAINTRLSQY